MQQPPSSSPATQPPAVAPIPPTARRDYSSAARSLVGIAILLGLLAAGAHWAWHQPAMVRGRMLIELAQLPAPEALPVPVAGVAVRRIADTYGAPRGRDRQHQGVDIFASAGTPVRSSTRGVVTSIRDSGLGGRQVWVLGPGSQRHYYAHLRDWAPGLREGDLVDAGMDLGSVGTTGNARGTPPHLHYGIYTQGGAIDPLPLLRNHAPGSTR